MNKDSRSPARIKLALRRVSVRTLVRTLSDGELAQVAGGTISMDTLDPTGCRSVDFTAPAH